MRSVEDIKDRFYKITAPKNTNKNDTQIPYVYDVAHEKNRKRQLDMYLRIGIQFFEPNIYIHIKITSFL